MKVDLLGKKALISGGSRGIGGAIALALAEAGASVAIFGRDIDSLNRQKVKPWIPRRLVIRGIVLKKYGVE